MPQKSQYIQAPFTVEQLSQAMKDDFSFLGADVSQTGDNDIAFDHAYWLSKVKVSTKNKVPESEQLVWGVDYADFASSMFSNDANRGIETLIVKNQNVAVPFKLYNKFTPRVSSTDAYTAYQFNNLKTDTNYTFSYWIRTNSGSTKYKYNVGRSGATQSLANGAVETISNEWQRKSYTFNTTSYNNMWFHFGGWNSWQNNSDPKNYALYSESLSNWSFWYGSYQNSPQSHTPPTGYTGLNADYLDVPGGYNSMYTTVPYNKVIGGNTVTLSMWVKRVTGSDPFIQITNLAYNVGSPIVQVGGTIGEWKRVSTTWVVPDNQTDTSFFLRIGSTTGERFGIAVWGVQLENGSEMTSYSPSTGSVSAASATHHGDLCISGFQLEEGTLATEYEPNTRWFYKELTTPLVLNETLASEAMNISYAVPAGVSHSFMNVEGEYNSTEFYRGDCAVFNSVGHFDTTTNYSPTGKTSVWVKNNYNVSGGNFYLNNLYRTTHPSDFLRGVHGAYNSNTAPLGDVHFSFGPDSNDAGLNATYKIKATIYGVMFRVSDKGTDFGAGSDWGKLVGTNAHIKTPGNGHRKLISTSLIKHNTNGNIQINQYMPTYASNGRSNVAEYDNGYLYPIISGKQLAEVRANDWHYRARNSNQLTVCNAQSRMLNVIVNANTDLFSFTEGAADGFLYGLNANSTFIMTNLFADFVNSPIPGDNGTVYSRITNGYTTTDLAYAGVVWLGHGPQVSAFESNGMSNFKGAGGKKSSNVMPDYYELFGEDSQALNRRMIYPIFATFANGYIATLRGQVKNFYLTHISSYSGNPGDLLIGLDGSKYFCYYKLDETYFDYNTYSSQRTQRACIHFVKV